MSGGNQNSFYDCSLQACLSAAFRALPACSEHVTVCPTHVHKSRRWTFGFNIWTKDYDIDTLSEHAVINKLCMWNECNILRPITSHYMTPSVYLRRMWPIKILHPRPSWLWSKRRSTLLLPVHGYRRTRQNGLTFNISFCDTIKTIKLCILISINPSHIQTDTLCFPWVH